MLAIFVVVPMLPASSIAFLFFSMFVLSLKFMTNAPFVVSLVLSIGRLHQIMLS